MNGASQRIKSNFEQEQSAMKRNGTIDLGLQKTVIHIFALFLNDYSVRLWLENT